MSGQLPAGLEQSFGVAAGELGMCTASWVFAGELAQSGGVEALRDRLGRAFPVLDAVSALWLEQGVRGPSTDPTDALEACAGASRLLVVGMEAAFLDALVPRLPAATRIALLRSSPFQVDWDRVASNFGGRVELLDLDDFQSWAGPRSVMLTFAYGVQGASAHVLPAWLRACGDDVRTQFRSLVAWDVIRAPMFVYPRWLVETPTSSFTDLV